MAESVRDLRRAIYGDEQLRQEGDIPRLQRVTENMQKEHGHRITRLEWGVLALLATGLARGAGELAAKFIG